ncbi:MAG: hypothetical protein LLG00_11930 [Planctomycetaceae bacterium]|nr:hypothetical protein [Planctomycetaceae bacterium]
MMTDDDLRGADCQPTNDHGLPGGSHQRSELDEQLVAYLDGELDPEAGRRIEALLASDPEVRRRLQSLERTWDLLDELDTAPVGEPFTHTTLEMVAVAARDDVDREKAAAPRRRRRFRLMICAGLLAIAAAGFLATALLAPDPNRLLLQDLPVLTNLDEYRQVENIQFLQLLYKQRLFLGENSDQLNVLRLGSDDSVEARRRRVETMIVGEKDQLRRAQERFLAMQRADQQRLRRFDAELRGNPDAETLESLMHRYCDWLKTLPLYSRGELAELAPDARIKRIKRILDEQAHEGAKRLSGKDAEVLRQWMADCVSRREAAFLNTLPDAQRKRLSEFNQPATRHRILFGMMWQRGVPADTGRLPKWVTENDLAQLQSQLSPAARTRLEELATPDRQWEQIVTWTRHGPRPSGAAHATRGPFSPDDERLAAFFEKLEPQERDRLLSLPGEEMQRQLQRLYLTRTRPAAGQGHHPDNPDHSKRLKGDQPLPATRDAPSRPKT